MIVCLDANCVIYLVAADATWGPKITARLADLRAAGDEIALSDLCRTECLAAPFAAGDAAILADYQNVLCQSHDSRVAHDSHRLRAGRSNSRRLPFPS